MIDEYVFLINQLSYKIIEVFNPVTKEKEVILYTEYMPPSSPTDYLTVEGIIVTKFLEKDKIYSRDNQTNFQTNFTAFMQKTNPVRLRFSSHFPYKIIS